MGESEASQHASRLAATALAGGFFHFVKLSAYSKSQFGEMPEQTLKQSRGLPRA